MTHRISIHLRRVDGALVRLLGLAERRGYPPVELSAEPAGQKVHHVCMTVAADHGIDPLIHQLNKLYDVQHIEVIS